MIRKNKGLLYVLKASGRTRTEPLSVLTEVAAHYLLTRSFEPFEYSNITRNADFTLALLSQFVKQAVHNYADAPPEHDADAPPQSSPQEQEQSFSIGQARLLWLNQVY